MMKQKEVRMIASTLADYLETGMEVHQAVARLDKVLPKYEAFFKESAKSLRNGIPFSRLMEGQFHNNMLTIIRSGEESGDLARTMRDIENSIDIELEVQAVIKQVNYPLGMLLGGLVLGFLMVIFLVPVIAPDRNKIDNNIVLMALTMGDSVKVNYPFYLVALAGVIAGIVHFIRSDQGKGAIFKLITSINVLRGPIVELRFGVWARYMAMAVGAGIGTAKALSMTENILPTDLRKAIVKVREDIENNISMQDAVDVDRLPVNDIRHTYLPFLIINSFIVASQTGQLNTTLEKTSPTLIKQGKEKIARIVSIGRGVAMGISAFVICSPMALIYSVMFNSLDNL